MDETYNGIVPRTYASTSSGRTLVDRASYSNVRRFINMNSVVPFDAVRIEEMLNYFNLNYTTPKSDSLFGSTLISPVVRELSEPTFVFAGQFQKNQS